MAGDLTKKKLVDCLHLLRHLETVGEPDDPLDAGLVGVHDRHLGDGTAGDRAVQERLAVTHVHRHLENVNVNMCYF